MRSILAFGDSNTWGLIPGTHPKERYPFEVRWTGVLQGLCDDVRIIEEGLCGRTTVFEDALRPGRRGLASLPVILDSHSPLDGVILMLGTNDCKTVYGATPYTIGKGIGLCLDEIKRYVDPSGILLVSPLLLGEDVWREEKDPEFGIRSVSVSKELKSEYAKISNEHGVHFLAASDYVTADLRDDEHLNEDGHRILAERIYARLQAAGII